MPFSPNAASVYADGPTATPLQPAKREIRAYLLQLEAATDAIAAGAGTIAKQTLAQLNGDLAHSADTMAWVYADGNVTNNGIYRKNGGTGSGSWTFALPLPYTYIAASNSGTGTQNAIKATSTVPVTNGMLVSVNVTVTNSGTPVTISFNNQSPLTIKTRSGLDIGAGDLTPGYLLGVRLGSIFYLLSDVAVASLIYAARDAAYAARDAAQLAQGLAEAAQHAAEAARDIAAGYASDAVSQGNVPIYATINGMPALSIPAGINAIRVNGLAAAGDGGGGLFTRQADAPSAGPMFQTADGSWWAIERKKALSAAMFSTLQNAINAAAGAILLIPAGDYVATGLQGVDNIEIVADGRVNIKRPDNDPSFQAILTFTGKTNFKLRGDIALNGNRANNTIASNCLTVDGCGNYTIEGISGNNATGCGCVITNSIDIEDGTYSRVTGNEFNNNAQYGLYSLSGGNHTIDDNEASDNTLIGILCDGSSGLLFKNFILTNNVAMRNGQSGIFAWGHRNNDPGNTSLRNVVIANNIAESNAEWGIAAQAFGMTVTGNICYRNGSGAAHAGLLINGVNIVATANVIEENSYFGIDAGDAVNLIITANHVNYNGGVGINVEAAQKGGVKGNFLTDNGNPTSNFGWQIYLRGIGGADDNSPFLNRLNGFDVDGNMMTVTHTGYVGLIADADCDDISIGTNPCFGFSTPGIAIIVQCETVSYYGESAGDAKMRMPVLPSADVLIIPDVGTCFAVSGSATIFNIRTERENSFVGKIRRIDIPAGQGGSGYTSSFDFTVPGGAGATAKALVYGGKVVQVRMITNGSGLSADFSGVIPGGTGSGANFFAEVGCINSDGRQIELFFQNGLTVANGGNIGNLGGDRVLPANARLNLRGKYGNYYA